MKIASLALLSIFLTAQIAIAQGPPVGDVTVRVLTSAHPHELQLVPLDRAETIRKCAACAAHSAPAGLKITAIGARLSSSSLGQHPKEVFAGGRFRLLTGQQPPLLVAGKLHITASANHLLVRLTLPMERYIAGVLNGETAPDESLESLKAMAIVARTYAMINHARHQAEGFDLCDDTHCQVVRWTIARPLIEQAVSQTAGETLWYQGTRAQVFFHQQCGGMTADVHDVFPNEGAGPLPYLRAHRDIYCVKKSSAEWQSEVRVADLQHALSLAGIHARFDGGSLSIATRTDAGRAHTVSVDGVEVPANTFRIAVDRTLGWNTIKSDWYEIESRGDTVAFHGRGSGHGVGLCQTGAAEMAREGFTASAILAEYFPGTNIGITANDLGTHARYTSRLTTP